MTLVPEPGKLGDSFWESGKGYQRPADSGAGDRGLPPGWGDPHKEPEPQVQEDHERATDEGMPEAPAQRGEMPALMQEAQAAADFLLSIPEERVNLMDGTAVFRGHRITLTYDGINSIKTILAMEVCRMLDEEKERVFASVQLPSVQELGGGERTNMPEVPGSPEQMEP